MPLGEVTTEQRQCWHFMKCSQSPLFCRSNKGILYLTATIEEQNQYALLCFINIHFHTLSYLRVFWK